MNDENGGPVDASTLPGQPNAEDAPNSAANKIAAVVSVVVGALMEQMLNAQLGLSERRAALAEIQKVVATFNLE